MMAVVTPSHRSPTGGRFWCRSSAALWPPNAGAMPPITPKSPYRKQQPKRSAGCNRRSTTDSLAQRITRARRPAVKSP